MRALRTSRRAGALVAAIAAGVLGTAAPAAADVTVDPPSAPQGGGLDLTFHVTNEHARAALTRVRLVLPADTPVAEVYPLSVDDWAPQMIIRELDEPLAGIHGGIPVTQTTAAIVWTAMPGRGIPPGGSADLPVSMGPLPDSAQMRFTVQPTYADGSSVPAVPPVSLALTPATADTGHTAHDPGVAPPVDPDAVFGSPQNPDPGRMSLAGWIVAALTATAGGILLLRNRRGSGTGPAGAPRPATTKDSPGSESAGSASPGSAAGSEPAGSDSAGSGSTAADGRVAENDRQRMRVTAWSYRDGP